MLPAIIRKLLATVPTSRTPPSSGATRTSTFQPYAPYYPLAFPTYLEHMRDIAQERAQTDSRQLLKDLFKLDPDISAAVHAYLTLANTQMIAYAVDINGNIDPKGSQEVYKLINKITRQIDYTKGFTLKESLPLLNADLRYMNLLRGGIASELVYVANEPNYLRIVDSASLRWFEPTPGQYKPGQLVLGDPLPRLADYPTFHVSFYRRDPTTIYTYSDFVSAINTVTARQQVINDLYRIMRLTGYPRVDIKIVESVIIDNAPLDIKSDKQKLRAYVQQQMAAIGQQFTQITVDEALTHSDSVEVKILNDKASGIAVDITPVMDTLNAQNQAALKVMPTVLGRGEAGANTGSVEARMAAMYADELNVPIADTWAAHLSYAMHQTGYQGWVDVSFRKAELRPETELEPQLLLKSNRLRQDLSDGIISDTEYTLMMYGRLPLKSAPKLSGTNFVVDSGGAAVDDSTAQATDVSPNTDPLGRSVSPGRTGMTKANNPKSAPVSKNKK